MHDNYELRLYDETLVSFELRSDTSVGFEVNIKNIKGAQKLLPIDLELTNEGILKWLERRVIPKNRTYVSSKSHK